jgi:hypothetical protein
MLETGRQFAATTLPDDIFEDDGIDGGSDAQVTGDATSSTSLR